MKWVFTLLFIGEIIYGFGQAFYKSGDLIGDGWTSDDPIHILGSTAVPSSGYSESNTSPSATGSNNTLFNNCALTNTNATLTSIVISSIGKTNIRIGLGRRRSSASAAIVSLAWFDGSNWNSLGSVNPSSDDTWGTVFYDLPSGANNNGNLRFQFSFTTNRTQSCTAAPNVRIDDFWVGSDFKLPIQLSSFDLSNLNGKPNITWASYSEQNNQFYSLERSADAINFVEIKKIKGFGAGTTDKKMEYNHVDQYPHPGINYYRLRQVDLNGIETLYPTKSIFIIPEKTTVFPTVFDTRLSILFSAPPSEGLEWRLINTKGQLMSKGRFIGQSLMQEIQFYPFMTGVYSLLIFDKYKLSTYKLLKK